MTFSLFHQCLLYSNVRISSTLLNQDVSHGFDVFGAIIRRIALYSVVSTRVGIVSCTSSAKPDFGISGSAVSLIISKDTDSCFSVRSGTGNVNSFFIASSLQGGLRANQRLPRVTTQ